jgi:ActD protein
MKDLFGIIAVFRTPEALTNAAARLRRSGYRAFDAYTPYAVEGLDRIIDPGKKALLPLLMFAAATLGAALVYWIQYWDEALNYPINVGGRPYNSWPAFAVSTFEFMLLAAVAAGFLGMLAASRLPQLYHPIFEARAFTRASRDRFIICVEATDPRFDADSIHALFEELGAERIEEVRA